MRKRTYDLAMRTVLSSTTRGHRVLYRVSGGRLGRRFPGGTQVVWITALGRKSGQWRRTPLLSVGDPAGAREAGQQPTGWVVAGSNAGQAKVPAWVFNARESPEGFVEVDGSHWRARFEEVNGDERDELYGRLTQSWKGFEMYAEHAERYIPVFRVVLGEPVSPETARPATPS